MTRTENAGSCSGPNGEEVGTHSWRTRDGGHARTRVEWVDGFGTPEEVHGRVLAALSGLVPGVAP